MNDSTVINNSFNFPSFVSPLSFGSSNYQNIKESYSSNNLPSKNSTKSIQEPSTSSSSNSVINNDHAVTHSSQLKLNLNIINRQMSNMFITNTNVLNCKTKSLSVDNFNFSICGNNNLLSKINSLETALKQNEIEKENLRQVIKQLSLDNKLLKEKINEIDESNISINHNNNLDTTISTIYDPGKAGCKTSRILYLKKKILDNTVSKSKSPTKHKPIKKIPLHNNKSNAISYLNLSKITNNNSTTHRQTAITVQTQTQTQGNCSLISIPTNLNVNECRSSRKYSPIMEKKVCLTQKKIKILINSKMKTIDNNSNRKFLRNSIMRSHPKDITCLKTDTNEMSTKIIINKQNELYRFDSHLKCIIAFNVDTMQFKKIPIQELNNDFLKVYKDDGASYLSTINGLFIITGPTYQMFFGYIPSKGSIIQFPQLKYTHLKCNLVSYKKSIICIGGISSTKVEMINLFQNTNGSSLETLPDLNYQRMDSSSIIVNDILYNMFGFDYNKQCYLDTIEYLNLNNPVQWISSKIDSDIQIKNFGLVCDGDNTEKFILIGGTKLIESQMNSLIELYNCGNHNYIINTIDDDSNIQAIFTSNFVDINSKLKYAFDSEGNVHSFDFSYFKHEIYKYS